MGGLYSGSVLIGGFTSHVLHVFRAISVLLLVSLVSSLAGFLNGVFANTLDQVKWVPTFVLTPLTYFGGVFYSVSLLPSWAQKSSLVDPIFYMVDLFRYSMFGISDVHFGVSMFVMLSAAFAMFAAATALLVRGNGIRE